MPDQARSMDGRHFSAIGVRLLQDGESPRMAHISRASSHSTRKKPDLGVCQVVAHSPNSAYSDGSSQILWEDGERVFHRG